MFLVAADAFRDDAIAKYGCLVLAALPLLVTLGVGIYFVITQPDRLHSEEFVLRQQELIMIERKGGHPLPVNEIEADRSGDMTREERS